MKRSDFFQFTNGPKIPLPFSDKEYENRLKSLRRIMVKKNLDVVILTSLQNVAYYSGFLYCSFGRPYACVITDKRNIVVSAHIDAGQPGRRCYGENLIYTEGIEHANYVVINPAGEWLDTSNYLTYDFPKHFKLVFEKNVIDTPIIRIYERVKPYE